MHSSDKALMRRMQRTFSAVRAAGAHWRRLWRHRQAAAAPCPHQGRDQVQPTKLNILYISCVC